MKTRPARKFTFLDALILLAATALGFGVVWVFWTPAPWVELPRLPVDHPQASVRAIQWTTVVPDLMLVARTFLSSWALALLLIRLRRPRPRLRALMCQPGMAACSAAALMIVVYTLWIVAAQIGEALSPTVPIAIAFPAATPTHPVLPARLPTPQVTLGTSVTLRGTSSFLVHPWVATECGGAVIGAWLALALTGRWRPEPSWIDRLGRIVGVAIVASNIIDHAILFLIKV